jgi:hypothetical protein
MKNIIDICKDFGIEIPADKHAEFNKAVAENYKTIAEHEKKVNRLTDDLAAEKKRADDAVETLKGFEGKDFDAIIRDRDEWKTKHDNAVAAHQKEQEEREFNEMLSNAISESKGKNNKAITALLDLDALRKSKNQEKDIKAALEGIKKDNEYLFDTTGTPPARFDDPGNKGNPAGTLTRDDIMKITDRAERRAAMAKNQHLF